MTDEKKFFVTSGIFIEAMVAIMVCATSISLSLLLRLYMPPLITNMFVPISVILLVAALLVIRRIRIPALTVIPANLLAGFIYLVLLDRFTGIFGSAADMVFYIAIVLINIIYSVAIYFKPRIGKLKRDGPMALLGVHAILMVPISLLEEPDRTIFNRFLLVNVLIIFLTYFAARQISEFENGYYYSLRSSMVPVETIRKQNYKTIILVVGGVIFSALMVMVLPIDYISQYLSYFIRSFLRNFFRMLPKDDYGRSSINDDAIPYPTIEQGSTLTTESLYAIVIILLVLIGLYILFIGVKFIIESLLDKVDRKVTKQSEFVTDVIEDISAEDKKSRKQHRKHDFGKGYEYNIRKKFYDTTRYAIKHGAEISPSASPDEITKIILSTNNKDIAELKSKYEDVRYNPDSNLSQN